MAAGKVASWTVRLIAVLSPSHSGNCRRPVPSASGVRVSAIPRPWHNLAGAQLGGGTTYRRAAPVRPSRAGAAENRRRLLGLPPAPGARLLLGLMPDPGAKGGFLAGKP